MARVTRAQAAQYKAMRALPRHHEPLLAGLRTKAVTKSVALQLAKWTQAIPAEFRGPAEEILVAAARAGADLRALAQICAEIRSRTVPPDPDGNDPALDRALFLDTTLDGAGVLRGDLTPECAAMVQAVLDALSAPAGAGDLRTRPQRYHDALAEAMRRLLASNLLPQRAGQPVKALVHMSFADLCELDVDSKLQDAWIAGYRARWAAQRAAASVSTGDGGAWLEGDAARRVACDAMIIPVVTADLDPGAVEQLVGLCVQYDHLRRQAPAGPAGPRPGPRPGRRAGRPGGAGAGHAGAPDPGHRPADRLRPRRRRLLPPPEPAGQGPERPVAAAGRRADRRHPDPPAPAGGPAGPEVPVPRRLHPARRQLRTAPCGAPPGRRAHEPGGPETLLPLAPSRGAPPDGLDTHRPPGRDERGEKPRREDHPKPQPATCTRVLATS